MNVLDDLLKTHAPSATLLIRLAVGSVFLSSNTRLTVLPFEMQQGLCARGAQPPCQGLSEGIQKFLFPDQLGVGRFLKIGIPAPQVMAPFVGWAEIVCGSLLLLGLLTRLAAIPLIIDMLVAIATTKVPMLMKLGFWAMAHEARVDFCMLLGSLFLLITGAGLWSLDARLTRHRSPHAPD